MKAVCEDIRFLLDQNSFGVSGTDLFSFEWGSNVEGDEIDSQILILDADDIETPLKELYENPTFTILVRGSKVESGKTVHDRARAVYEFMIQRPSETIDGTDYLQFEPITGLVPIGRDENDRHVYTMTFYTYRDPI